MVDKLQIIKREGTEIEITYENWEMLEEIFMGSTKCDSLQLILSEDYDDEWSDLREGNPILHAQLKKLCEDNDGFAEIALE